MPRYEIRRTSDDALTYVEGNLPLNLMLSQAAGTYRARVMSDERATDIVVPTLTASITQSSLTVGQTATFVTNAPAGSTFQWVLNGTDISGATGVIGTNPQSRVTANPGTLTVRVAIPGSPQPPVTSAGVTVAAGTALGFVQAWSNSGPSNGTQRTVASGVTIPAGRYLLGAVYRISGGVPTWAASPFSFAGTPLTMLAAHFDGTNANAVLLELASDTTGDLVANATSNSTNWRGIELMLVRIGTLTLGTHQRAQNSRGASAATPADFANQATVAPSVTIAAGGALAVFGGRSGPSADAPAEGFLQNSTRVHSRTTATDDLIGPVAGFDTGLSAGSRSVSVAYVNPTTQALRQNAIIAVPLNP